MKILLFQAIQPDFVVHGHHDWDSFLREASQVDLPLGSERLAQSVWLLPDGYQTEIALARMATRWNVETQIRAFVHASDWQPLSPRP